MKAEFLEQYFSPERQRHYVRLMLERGGFTRRRAECFVRLWGYLLLKDYEAKAELPTELVTLLRPANEISCTHREASILFYDDREQGSQRAAGLMIDRLVSLGLITKRFDGETLCIGICDLPELVAPIVEKPVELMPDYFNPVTDAVLTAQLMVRTYAELVKDTAKTAHKITKCLRLWGKNYGKCIRVLRRSDTLNPVAVSILYPTTEACEHLFFESPTKTFFLTTETAEDPFEMAIPGEASCTSVYVRAWLLDPAYMNGANLAAFIYMTQDMMREMREDFPELCDIYSMVIHPSHERLRQVMGFEKVAQDNQRAYHWVYLPIDRYLMLQPEDVVAALHSGG
jgi:hypothetical protein